MKLQISFVLLLVACALAAEQTQSQSAPRDKRALLAYTYPSAFSYPYYSAPYAYSPYYSSAYPYTAPYTSAAYVAAPAAYTYYK